jgi:hypothetical protein
MPDIHAIDFDLQNRELRIADLLPLADRPPDHLPFMASQGEVAALVSSHAGPHAFLCQDFPGITTVWVHARTAALVFYFRDRRLILADLILLGANASEDASALRSAQQRLCLSFEETKRIFNRRRPTLVRFLSRSAHEDHAALISFIVGVPTLCELNQIS